MNRLDNFTDSKGLLWTCLLPRKRVVEIILADKEDYYIHMRLPHWNKKTKEPRSKTLCPKKGELVYNHVYLVSLVPEKVSEIIFEVMEKKTIRSNKSRGAYIIGNQFV